MYIFFSLTMKKIWNLSLSLYNFLFWLLIQYYWLIHFNDDILSRVILCLVVRESHSLYVCIYIFCIVISSEFFFFFAYIYLSHWWLHDKCYPLGQSGPGSNDNEGVLHTTQIFRTGASSSDAVQCHTKDTPFLGWGVLQVIQ